MAAGYAKAGVSVGLFFWAVACGSSSNSSGGTAGAGGALAPYTLSASEIASHDVGILSLEASLDKLKASDPSKPGVACTWMPIAEPSTPASPAPPPPSGFVDRVRLLLDRIVHGARQ